MSIFKYHVIIRNKNGAEFGLYRYKVKEQAEEHLAALLNTGIDAYIKIIDNLNKTSNYFIDSGTSLNKPSLTYNIDNVSINLYS